MLLHLCVCSSCPFTSFCDAVLLQHPAQLAQQLARAQVQATQAEWHGCGTSGWKRRRKRGVHTHRHTHMNSNTYFLNAKWPHPIESGGFIVLQVLLMYPSLFNLLMHSQPDSLRADQSDKSLT